MNCRPALASILLFAHVCACDADPSAVDTPASSASSAPSAPSAPTIEARVRVGVEPAAVRPLTGAGELTGVVEPFARVVVAAETAARVDRRHIERGDRVEADALLYTLDSSRARIEYSRAQASVGARRGDLEQAERERSRSAQLYVRQDISTSAHERSTHAADSAAAAEQLARISTRAASRSLRDAKIHAPFAGIVAEFHVERGDFVGPGTPVLTLVDLSRVRLRVGLTASELELVELGARVPVSFAELGGRSLQAELRSVSPLADPRTGTYAAELWLDNPDERLRQGMRGRLALTTTASGTPALAIPRAAVVRRGRGYFVWVVDESQAPARVEARALILGRADGQRVAVLDGLAPGDQVVVEGMFALRERAAVVVEASPAN